MTALLTFALCSALADDIGRSVVWAARWHGLAVPMTRCGLAVDLATGLVWLCLGLSRATVATSNY